MPNTQRSNIYNSRIAKLGMSILSLRIFRAAILLAVIVFLCGATSLASDWSGPEGQLASKIAAVTGPGAVALDIANRSSLTHVEFEEISRGLRSQLAALGLRFVNADQAAATVRLSLSENLQSCVWVAEIRQGADESSVTMITTPRNGGMPSGRDSAVVTIHKALMWSQPQRILDVAIIDGYPAHMAVLDENHVGVYRLENSHWLPEQSLAITHVRTWPRDLRGRLVLRKDHLLDVYLPGVYCRSTASLSLTLNCYESDDPWPLGTEQLPLNAFFTPSRNYFTGALAPGVGKQTSAPPFYSAAALPRDKYTLWLFAAVDGKVHLLDGISDQVAGKLDWGSDIASIHGACGSGWNILAAGSAGPRDSLRVFEVLDREPISVSQPAEFPGPITALWTETNGTSAIAVSRNLETGDYEAFRLSFTCGQ